LAIRCYAASKRTKKGDGLLTRANAMNPLPTSHTDFGLDGASPLAIQQETLPPLTKTIIRQPALLRKKPSAVDKKCRQGSNVTLKTGVRAQ